MTLIGTKRGRYEIQSAVGAGGMGEVYSARDPQLNRVVAIKIIPASLAGDDSRLRRFQQEAHAAAALNHPNILAVYDVGTDNGSPYIVSELLEGDTLRDRLRSGPLPIRKAVDYAQQIARGLAAAHDKGIVHRDLKPDNIFVTRDGRVKILDFGLAKLTQPESSANDATRTVASDAGTIVGTVGYMSPEQIRGKPADARSDIFSFGAVLYEMLTGQRAFKGDTAADTITAILTHDAPEVTRNDCEVPPALSRIVQHCLEKQSDERFQSAHDVAFNLETISVSSSTTLSRGEPVATKSRVRILIVASIAITVAAAAAALWFALRPPASPVYRQLTFRRGFVGAARFTPDGESILYGASWNDLSMQVFSTRADGRGSRPLDVPPADILGISRSGDMALLLGSHHVFTWITAGTLARASVAGGAPREIMDNVNDGDISPDGSQFAVVRQVGAVQRLEWPIGKVLYETRGYISNVRFSAVGDSVAFVDHPMYGDDDGAVSTITGSGHRQHLTEVVTSVTGLAWAPSGKEIWFSCCRGEVKAVTLSGRQRRLLQLPADLNLQDVSRDGRVLVTEVYSTTRVIGVTPDNQRIRDFSWSTDEELGGLSHDGKLIALSEYREGGLAFRRTDGSPAVHIGEGYAMAVAPDGKWVVAMNPVDRSRLLLLPTGAGDSRTFDISPVAVRARYAPLDWTAHGLVFTGTEPGHGERGYVLDVESGKIHAITPEGVTDALLSPSGKLVFAAGPAMNPSVLPVEGGNAKPIKLNQGDAAVGWDAGGNNLYVWSPAWHFPARVFLLNVDTNERSLWQEIVPPDPTGVLFGRMLIAPDGRAYMCRYRQRLSELYVVQGIR